MSSVTTGSFLGRIPYAQVGDAPAPLLVINGGQGFVRRATPARQRRDARNVARLLPAGAGFVLLGYDPRPPAGLSAAELARDVAAIVEQLGAAPVTLFGISYGGLVATRLAASRPELVRRLILVASAHRFSSEGAARVRRQIAFAECRNFAGFVDDFAVIFRRRWLNAMVRLRLRFGRGRLDEGMADPVTIVRYLRAMLDGESPPLEAITARTLVTGGSEDQFFGHGTMAETAARISGARLALLDGETHMAPVERARDMAAIIGRFLDE